jgi:hypothetical protein
MKLFQKVALVALAVLGAALPARAGEKAVKESDISKPALEAVKKKYPKAKLVKFAKEEEDGKTTYEVSIEDGKRKIDIDLSPEGKILAEEETIEADALPKEVKKGLAESKYAKWKVKRAEKIVEEEKAEEATYELLLTDGENTSEVVFDKAGKITHEEEKKKKAKGGKEKKGEDDDDD